MPHTHFDFLELFFALWGMKPFSVAVWLIPPHSLLLCHFLPRPKGDAPFAKSGSLGARSRTPSDDETPAVGDAPKEPLRERDKYAIYFETRQIRQRYPYLISIPSSDPQSP
jgi:hypothetical protein